MNDLDPSGEGAKLGMWLFLVTEFILFGGLFLAYSYLRHLHPAEFHRAGGAMNVPLGLLNTLILLTSSLTLALAVEALREGRRGAARGMLGATLALGGGFLAVKAVEWAGKYQHGLMPGMAHLTGLPAGEQVFFGLYFMMTGLHGVHVLAGLVLLTGFVALGGRLRPLQLECGGLYWHLVDVIWIILLPLFYLAA